MNCLGISSDRDLVLRSVGLLKLTGYGIESELSFSRCTTPFSCIWAHRTRRVVFPVRHFRGHAGRGGLDQAGIFSARHFRGHRGSGERRSWRLQSIRRSLCLQNCCSASPTTTNSHCLWKWPAALLLMSLSQQRRNMAANRFTRLATVSKSSEIQCLLGCML